MEQFSLEKYLQDPTRKTVTRDGLHARIICVDMMNTDRPIVALVTRNGCEEPLTYEADGSYAAQEHKHDLFFAPTKQSRWVFLNRGVAGDVETSAAYTSKEAAEYRMNKLPHSFGLTEITWEE